MIRSYQEFKVWQLAEEVFQMVCENLKNFPQTRTAWTIGDQIVRSVGSIGAKLRQSKPIN